MDSNGPSASGRRRYRIRSDFGQSRQWRSRKSRPCDACRRRKTACVIDSQPPCRYCQSKGLECQATASSITSAQPSAYSSLENVDTSITAGTRPPRTTLSPASESSAELSPPWPGVHEEPIEAVPIAISPDILEQTVESRVPVTSTGGTRSDAGSVPWKRSNETAIYTLEDNVGQTAHSMGLSAEQDTGLLASFKTAVIDEVNRVNADIIQIYPGCADTHEPPVHFSLLHDEFAPTDNIAKQAASDRIEAAVGDCANDLVRVYFKHVHPVYPLLSKTRFLEAYFTNKQSTPASIRGAVYGLASNFWRRDPEYSARSLEFNQHELFEDSLASLQREMHGPNLWTLQACLLLIHQNSADNATIETPRVWTLCSQAVACAQIIGLHRDPIKWNIPAWEKHLRKKLWWATVAADTWSSICHGNPPHIYHESFTTSALTMDDVVFGEDVPSPLQHTVDKEDAHLNISVCARLFEFISISHMVHELVLSSFLDVRYTETMADTQLRESGLLRLRGGLQDWASLLPRCLVIESRLSAGIRSANNAPIHLSFYAALALTFRALMSPVTKDARHDPNSSLRRFFPSAVDAFSPFIDFMRNISTECLHAFWGLHARSQLILCGNFLIYLFLSAPDPAQVEHTFHLLGSFHDSLHRLSAVADKVAISLLRPVALRIDSFFTQAAQIMRTRQSDENVPCP